MGGPQTGVNPYSLYAGAGLQSATSHVHGDLARPRTQSEAHLVPLSLAVQVVARRLQQAGA
eukprot:257709-Lingulodinium_polyedra.AAC.1